MDGSECIVSVKAKVVLLEKESNLIECDIDVDGFRDDSNYVVNLKYELKNLLLQNFPQNLLKLTTRYAFKLFLDCIVISHTTFPLTLLSLTSYLALKTTRLPLLVSEVDDREIAQQPTFSDDWDTSKLIQEGFQPPVFITLGVAGSNLIFDPSQEEEQVLENGIIVGFANSRVISPISNKHLAVNSNNSNFKGLNTSHILKSMELCNKYCPMIIKALDTLVEQDDEDGTIF